jgi:type IV pilus assembly protein PilQ
MRVRAAVILSSTLAAGVWFGPLASTVTVRAQEAPQAAPTAQAQATTAQASAQAAPAPPPQAAPAPAAPAPAPPPAAVEKAQSTAPAATRLTSVAISNNADGVVVTIKGNGRLAYSSMQEADRPPARLVIDFQGVRPDVPPSTQGHGVLRRVRVALNSPEPLVTRVVLDLDRMVGHRIRPSSDGREVTVTLESAGGAPESTAAAGEPAAAAPAPKSSRPPRSSAGAKSSPADVASETPTSASINQATRLTGIVLGQGPDGVTVTLKGNGRLLPRPVEQAKDAPPRLIVEIPGVRPSVPAQTRVNQGVVDRVRVALSSKPKESPVTRITVQMKKQFLYRMRTGQNDPKEVAITVADPAVVTEPSAEFVLADPVDGTAKPKETTKTAKSTETETVPRVRVGDVNRSFTGHPISLDFQGVDLRAVLRTFSEITGLNVVIDPGVKGTVDVSLREVPWDQALDIILRANQLGYTIEGSIVRIAPLDVLAHEEQARRALKEEQDLSGETKTLTRTLSYAKATQLQPLILKSALTKRGTIDVDDRTNTIILTDLEPGLDKARKLVDTLDTPQPQVEIEARIIDTTSNYSKELGIRLGIDTAASSGFGNTLPVVFPASAVGGANIGTVNSAASQVAQLALGSVNGAIKVTATVSAMEKEGKLKVISAPRVIMQNNIEGEIIQGDQIPYTTATAIPTEGGVLNTFQVPQVQFKDAALKLNVKPRITAAGTIIMDVSLERSAADFSRALPGNPNPAITTQKARTTVQVSDGSTAVIGGVMFEQANTNDDRTPYFWKLPVIGKLFKRTNVTNDTRELVLLITPKIVKG